MTESVNINPVISVVLCTYNNADSLDITLRQLLRQKLPQKDSVELILVNNNSTDHSEQVALQLQNSDIPARCVFEGAQGLSHARNRGVAEAKGEYILFTDDDAEIPDNWLALYLQVIAQYRPDCAFSGIEVIWDRPQPWWYIPEYRACFVELDYGPEVIQIEDINREFFGKNFCVRKEWILAQGGFDPALGRMGDKLVAGEETLLYRSLVQNRRTILYFPSAKVGHRLKPKEYTEQHIRKLFVDGAYSALQIAKVLGRKLVFRRPLGLLAQTLGFLVQSLLYWCLHSIRGEKPQAFYRKLCIVKALKILKLWVVFP